MEIRNAKIESTFLGFEDHGIFTYFLHLEWEHAGQGFGGYILGGGYGDETIKAILETVGVDKWEDLPGKYVRIEREHIKVHRIGNIIEDKWFSPAELSKKFEKKKSLT